MIRNSNHIYLDPKKDEGHIRQEDGHTDSQYLLEDTSVQHKNLKSSIPSYFLESDTSEHLYRVKLDEVLKQNEQLKDRILEIEY